MLKVGQPLKVEKRELFCQLYVGDPETWGNAAASYRKAGYAVRSSQQESWKALSDPLISDRVRQLQVWYEAQVEKDAEWMHTRLGWLSQYNVDDVIRRCTVWVERDADGLPLLEPHFEVDLSRIPRELSYCVEEVSYDSAGRPKIKMISKLKALELFGKLTKVRAFADDQVLSEDEDIAVMILRARARRHTEE